MLEQPFCFWLVGMSLDTQLVRLGGIEVSISPFFRRKISQRGWHHNRPQRFAFLVCSGTRSEIYKGAFASVLQDFSVGSPSPGLGGLVGRDGGWCRTDRPGQTHHRPCFKPWRSVRSGSPAGPSRSPVLRFAGCEASPWCARWGDSLPLGRARSNTGASRNGLQP